MEGLGKKLQEARLAKKIYAREAARVTKIRAARIQEIEAEDFSNFSSLAYAKGFLLIYGKFLDVDVTPYLDAFETSQEVSVDGYAYLQDPPSRARRRRSCGGSPAKTPCASSLYHCGGRLRAWLVSGQTVARHPTHHALSPCAGRSFLRNARCLPQRPPRISSRRARSPSKVRRPAKPTSRSRPRRKRRSLPRPSPKCAGPNRFIPKTSLRLTFPRRHSPIVFKSRRCGKPFCA